MSSVTSFSDIHDLYVSALVIAYLPILEGCVFYAIQLLLESPYRVRGQFKI